MSNNTGLLTEQQIIDKINNGLIEITPPLDTFQIQPHSIDLRLGFTFMIPKYWEITTKGREAIKSDYTKATNNFTVIELEAGQFFEILPNEYVIFSTLEKIKLPNDLMAILYPRSSVNRRGLSVDLSGIVDAGYHGQLIIPVRNQTTSQTIRVYPGERFCQLVFHPLSQPVDPELSRFHNKDVASTLGSQQEKHTPEIDFIRSGKIKELKNKHLLIKK